jgi:predicted nucleic acid-binding protein
VSRPVVLDASAGVEMLLATAVGEALDRLLPDDAVEWVPEVYFAEVAGVVRRSELAGVITSERAAAALDRLVSTPVERVQVLPLLSEAWTLRRNLTVNDALYVVLARHLQAPLVTGDLRLAAAPGLGVEVIRV